MGGAKMASPGNGKEIKKSGDSNPGRNDSLENYKGG